MQFSLIRSAGEKKIRKPVQKSFTSQINKGMLKTTKEKIGNEIIQKEGSPDTITYCSPFTSTS